MTASPGMPAIPNPSSSADEALFSAQVQEVSGERTRALAQPVEEQPVGWVIAGLVGLVLVLVIPRKLKPHGRAARSGGGCRRSLAYAVEHVAAVVAQHAIETPDSIKTTTINVPTVLSGSRQKHARRVGRNWLVGGLSPED
jgi:hypothetical protein